MTYFKRCETSEFLLGIQSYIINDENKKLKNRKCTEKENKPIYDENAYNLIASKFEKIKKLNHPNLCKYFGINRTRNQYFIFSEYYSISLYDILTEEKSNEEEIAEKIDEKENKGKKKKELYNNSYRYNRWKCFHSLHKFVKRYNIELSDEIKKEWNKNTMPSRIITTKILNKILYEILSAINYLHSHNIKCINATIKNVLITPKGKIKLHNYCFSYLFNPYISSNDDNKNFNLKNELMHLLNMNENELGHKPVDDTVNINYEKLKEHCFIKKSEGTNNIYSNNKNNFNFLTVAEKKKKKHKKWCFINDYFDYYDSGNDIIYCFPLFFFFNLLKNKKMSFKHDMLEHADIFSVGIIMLEIINGPFHLKNVLSYMLQYIDILYKSTNENIEEKKSIESNNTLPLYEKEKHNDRNNDFDKKIPFLNSLKKDSIKENNRISVKRKKYSEYVSDKIDRKASRVELKNVTFCKTNLCIVNVLKIKKVVQSAKVLKKLLDKEENKSNLFLNEKESTFYVKKYNTNTEKENMLNTIQNIFVLLLYLKCYFIYIYFKKEIKKSKKKEKLSLLHINMYDTFKNIFKKENNKKYYIKICYKIIKTIIEAMTNMKISIVFIKLIEKIYADLFYINSVKKDLRRLFSKENRNEKVLYMDLLYECLSLNQPKSADCLLSHYYFFYNEFNVTTKKENNTDEYLNKIYDDIYSNIDYKNNETYSKYEYYNSFLSNYILSIKNSLYRKETKPNCIKNKYYINKNNIFYWNFLLFNANYNLELSNDVCLQSYNILNIPALMYKTEKKKYSSLSLFEVQKFHIIKKHEDLFLIYKLLMKRKKGTHKFRKWGERKQQNKWKKKRSKDEKNKLNTSEIKNNNEDNKDNSYEIENDTSFFNISFQKNNYYPILKDCNIHTLGIRLNLFYKIVEDAYLYEECNRSLNYECVYKKGYSFLYQYKLFVKFKELLKQNYNPLNSIKIIKEIKKDFPFFLRKIVYLILLNYDLNLLISKFVDRESKLKDRVYILSRDKINEISIMENYNSNKSKEVLGTFLLSKSKKSVDYNNDLIGSIKFKKKINNLLLLINHKFMLRLELNGKKQSKMISCLIALAIPVTLLFYDSLYLAYKCLKRIINIYLLGFYKNKKIFFEFLYIFNSLLNYYCPDISIYFFKNRINIQNFILNLIRSLFCDFFDLENCYLLLDKIFTMPFSYLYFVCLSILFYLKKYIMKMTRYDFYQKIYSLSNLIDMNFLLKCSVELFEKSNIMFTIFPIHLKDEIPANINPLYTNNINTNKNTNVHCHINYLAYLIHRKNWFHLYVHRVEFSIYKKKREKKIKRMRIDAKEKTSTSRTFLSLKKVKTIKNTKIDSINKNNKFYEDKKMHILNLNENNEKKLSISQYKGNEKNNNNEIILKSKAEPENDTDNKGSHENILKINTRHKNVVSIKQESLKRKCYNEFLKRYNRNKKNKFIDFSFTSNSNTKCVKEKDSKKISQKYFSIKDKKYLTGNMNLVKINNFPLFPFFYAKDLLNIDTASTSLSTSPYISSDHYLLIDMRPFENYKTKTIKNSIHIDTFFSDLKKTTVYKDYIDNVNIIPEFYLKTIIFFFANFIIDFDLIYNIVNFKVKYATILYGGFENALEKLPAHFFT